MWLKAASVDQRKELADSAETSVNYLYQIAGGSRPNVSLRLAHRISRHTIIVNQAHPHLPEVTLDDLVPTKG